MIAPHRSASIDALYRDALTVWPGMTIFWIGDLAHQGEVSGHNPDDTPRVQAEQVDADSDPEVRALDFMIGPKFSASAAEFLVDALIHGVDRRRLYYVIYDRTIYRRANGFKPETYGGGDPHTNHVHVSGWAGDDANGADWSSILPEEDDMAEVYYELESTDAVWNGQVWVSNRIHRRGPIRAAGGVRANAIAGATKVVLTDAHRKTEAWGPFLDAVAGPEFPQATIVVSHTHAAVTTVGPSG